MAPHLLSIVERVCEQLQGPRLDQQVVGQSLPDLREALPPHLSAQVLHAPHLGFHRQHVESWDGDWFAICDCGWMSLSHVTRHAAVTDICIVSRAEGERLSNHASFLRRVAAAGR
jgi:hypothetical protein